MVGLIILDIDIVRSLLMDLNVIMVFYFGFLVIVNLYVLFFKVIPLMITDPAIPSVWVYIGLSLGAANTSSIFFGIFLQRTFGG